MLFIVVFKLFWKWWALHINLLNFRVNEIVVPGLEFHGGPRLVEEMANIVTYKFYDISPDCFYSFIKILITASVPA